jgi:O-6-methylguanine DNA methyltransferase
VWRALQATAPGETLTYGALARKLGVPDGARAVARACATNPVPLAIPCHRVVPADGTTGGYRLGAARKRALLERERAAATPAGRNRVRGAAA